MSLRASRECATAVALPSAALCLRHGSLGFACRCHQGFFSHFSFFAGVAPEIRFKLEGDLVWGTLR